MNEETLKHLDALAAKLGATGRELLDTMVAETLAAAWVGVASGVLLIVLAVVLARKMWAVGERENDETGMIGIVIGALIGLIGFAVAACHLSDLFAPVRSVLRSIF